MSRSSAALSRAARTRSTKSYKGPPAEANKAFTETYMRERRKRRHHASSVSQTDHTPRRPRRSKPKAYGLPLRRDGAGWLLVWLMGLMGFLLILASVFFVATDRLAQLWEQSLAEDITVEVMMLDPLVTASTGQPVALEQLVSELDRLDGVTASLMSDQDLTQLLSPYLGDGADGLVTDDGSLDRELVPLPYLIDLTTPTDATKRPQVIDTLKTTLTRLSSETMSLQLQDHQDWLDQFMRLSHIARIVTLGLALVIVMTAIGSVAGAVHTFLSLHANEVHILHTIGATDSYIAKQCARHSVLLALEGSAVGAILAGIVLFSLRHIGFGRVTLADHAIMPLWLELSLCISAPLLLCGVAYGVATITVRLILRKLT